jgi:hypothetical protein
VGTFHRILYFVRAKRQRGFPDRGCLMEEQQTFRGRVMNDDVGSNAAYYRAREQTERALADQAPADDIGKIHLQLAERYAELADQFEAQVRGGP